VSSLTAVGLGVAISTAFAPIDWSFVVVPALAAVQVDAVGPTGLIGVGRDASELHDEDGAWVVTVPRRSAPTFYREHGPGPIFGAIVVLGLVGVTRGVASAREGGRFGEWAQR
jgi:hypothetical protein